MDASVTMLIAVSDEENPSAKIDSSPSYLSVFKTYLAEHGLTDRVGFEYDSIGEDHNPTWLCYLYSMSPLPSTTSQILTFLILSKGDGVRFSTGEATTKQKSTEMAVRTAAANWNR